MVAQNITSSVEHTSRKKSTKFAEEEFVVEVVMVVKMVKVVLPAVLPFCCLNTEERFSA